MSWDWDSSTSDQRTGLNPPYSAVCRNRHVLVEDFSGEPDRTLNERTRCSQGGCNAPVYTHCRTCTEPVPGWVAGTGSAGYSWVLSSPYEPERTFHIYCPRCRSPYPWATTVELARYHAEHLRDIERAVQHPLPHNPDAEAAHNRSIASKKEQQKEQRQEEKRTARAARTEQREISAKRWTAYAVLAVTVIGLAGTIGGYFLGFWDGQQPSPENDTPPASVEQPVDE